MADADLAPVDGGVGKSAGLALDARALVAWLFPSAPRAVGLASVVAPYTPDVDRSAARSCAAAGQLELRAVAERPELLRLALPERWLA
jgi:hypothetical protein